MYIKQLSVFIENQTGRLEDVLKVLKKNEINIVSLSLADASDYGMLRLLVTNPQKGKEALNESGFSAMITEVLAVKLAHKVGKLQELLEVICAASINIEYMYAFSSGTDDASIVIKTADIVQAAQVLREAGVEFFTTEDIANM